MTILKGAPIGTELCPPQSPKYYTSVLSLRTYECRPIQKQDLGVKNLA